MRTKTLGILIALLLLSNLTKVANSQERYQATWESLENYKTPDWFRDAKFGIFIHWGVYSVPAFNNEWYPRNMYDPKSEEFKYHLENFGPHDKFGYKDFIPMFKAENFNADKMVELFKKAGARYMVPVAEHHDGFAMYKTALSKWNAFEMGPKRDVIGELAEAAKKYGLVFGLSSHRIEHWWYMNNGKKINSDVNNPEFADYYGPAREENETMSPEYMNDWLLRCIELVHKYEPQLFWFDWWIEQPALDPYKKSFASYYYNKGLEWNKGVVINYKYKSFNEKAAVLDLERGKLGGIRELPWQTDDAIGNKSWGYTKNNNFKSVQYVITNLIDIVSNNGNLLLNIGPRPDGTITEEETSVLLGTGDWLNINGEAIYSTRPWKISGEGPTESASGSFAGQDKPFTVKDIRFTIKGNALYAIVLGVPDENVVIRSLGLKANNGRIARVDLLGSQEKVDWKQTEAGLLIKPAKNYPTKYAVVFKIDFN